MLVRARSLRSAGRRRAGLYWGRQWAQADLSEAAVEQLMGDPVIEVQLLDRPSPDLPSVESIQPRPAQLKEPVMFEDGRLRARQEKLLEARDKAEAAQAAKTRGLPPPPSVDLPEPKPSELVLKVEPKSEQKSESKPDQKSERAQTNQTTTGPKKA